MSRQDLIKHYIREESHFESDFHRLVEEFEKNVIYFLAVFFKGPALSVVTPCEKFIKRAKV
jgi:hypothetical protein